MNPESKKYYENKSADGGDKKGSATEAGYNEENQKTIRKSPKENPAPSKKKDKPASDTKRIDQDAKPKRKNSGNDTVKR